jgi:NAD(P)-dependent dehydrogenase (short-subunit alcohol dehydrogenase family)
MSSVYPFAVPADEFAGKRVLVTGGTRGIGAAIVRRFQLSGARVAATARSPQTHGDASVLFVKADLGTVQARAPRFRQI